MINKRLVWYLEKENKIDTRQFGFRKQRNTIDAISKITTKILEGFRRREKTAAIFFDIEKAYDKINRESTFDQLEKMGVQGRMMDTIRELIKERWIKVRVGGRMSHSERTELGIPQGGVLSVTLFLVAINDILKELGNGVDGSLFADDLAIYTTTRNLRVATRALQTTTNKLEIWAVERGLKFSTSKTTTMVFRKRKKREEEPMEILLGNQIIPYRESTQFLGMTLDSRLSWGEHIDKTRAKAKRALNIIKIVAGKKWGADRKTLKKTLQCHMQV